MRILLATATLDDIRWATDNGLADGVTTTPSMVSDAASEGDARDHLAEICRATGLPVSVTVGAIDAADIYRDGRELAKLAENIVVQVPLIEDSVSAIRKLSAEGVRVGATFVFNAAQALLAAKAGATTVTTPIDQLDVYGLDAFAILNEIKSVFANGADECDVVASGVSNATSFATCALACADAVALPPSMIRALLLHPLTDRAVDRMLSDLSKRPKARLTT